jgi:hypothetical protein
MKNAIFIAGLFLFLGLQGSNAQEKKRDSNDTNQNRELLQLIRELRSEVALLRKEVNQLKDNANIGRRNSISRGDRPKEDAPLRDGDRTRESDRPRVKDRPRVTDRPRPSNPRLEEADEKKTKRVFQAYDKNKDSKVSFSEWLAMREGKITDERRNREQSVFRSADKNRNESLSFDEFFQFRKGPIRSEKPQLERARESDRDR